LSQWSYGFNLNWELDFWGRFRRAIEAADNTLDASVEGYDQVMVTLLGDIAQNYLQLRTDEEQIQLLVENVKLQRAIYDVTKAKLAGGRATITGLNVAQAEALLYQTAAQIPPLNVDRRQKNNQLCILMGIPPVELRDNMPVWKTEDDRKKERLQAAGKRLDELIRTIDPSQPAHLREIDRLWTVLGTSYIPQVPAEVVVGIPADVLRQRPDVRQAERQAAAQAQQIGIAEAALYPAFSIDGTLGVEAARLSHLFTEQALTGSVGPSFQWNILNYGRLINNVRFQDATFQELVATYQSTVLQANVDVENGLTAFLQEQLAVEDLYHSVRAYQRAVVDARRQYEVGVAGFDFNQYATIAQNLVQEQVTWAQARGAIAQGLIQVYRGLGGGWEIRCQPEGAAAGTAAPTMAAPDATPPRPAEEIPPPPAEKP
jgi:outer membrane protein TolC